MRPLVASRLTVQRVYCSKIRGVSDESAANYLFETEPGRQMNVAVSGTAIRVQPAGVPDDASLCTLQQYISQKYNYQIRFPWLPCVQLTKIAWCVPSAPSTLFSRATR